MYSLEENFTERYDYMLFSWSSILNFLCSADSKVTLKHKTLKHASVSIWNWDKFTTKQNLFSRVQTLPTKLFFYRTVIQEKISKTKKA